LQDGPQLPPHSCASGFTLTTLHRNSCINLPGDLDIDLSTLKLVFVLHLCTKFEVRRPSRSEDMTHFLSVSALVGMVTLNFDLLTLKLLRIIAGGVGNISLPI